MSKKPIGNKKVWGLISPDFLRQAKSFRHTGFNEKFAVEFYQHSFTINLSWILPNISLIFAPFAKQLAQKSLSSLSLEKVGRKCWWNQWCRLSNLIHFVATMMENTVFIITRSTFLNYSLSSHLNIMTPDYDYRVGQPWSRSSMAEVSKVIMKVALLSLMRHLKSLLFFQITFFRAFLPLKKPQIIILCVETPWKLVYCRNWHDFRS